MKPPLVEAISLGKRFPLGASWAGRLSRRSTRPDIVAVEEVSLSIGAGSSFGLVGESGSGKTTVGRMMVGLESPTTGEVRLDDKPLAAAVRGRVQMVFQDPFASLNPRWTVQAIVAEPLQEVLGIRSPQVLSERVAALLQSVGLSPSDASRHPHAFSGGQRQRISIARALATQPAFLVCDEPTSALDVSVQAQVLNLMKDVQHARHVAMLFISHNLAVVRHMSDDVGVMYLGRLVERAGVDELFGRPRHPYTRMLLAAVPDLAGPSGLAASPVGDAPDALTRPPGCSFHPRCPLAQERCRIERPLLKQAGVTWVACHAVDEGRD